MWEGELVAAPGRAVIEFDAPAESVLDARATRRLIDLELGEVLVPPAPEHTDVALFYRVLGDRQGRVRIELWERGELHGVRLVSGADGGRHLGARRVALAAAELARLLRGKRVRARVSAERARRLAAEEQRVLRERTLDGPVALRSSYSGELFADGSYFLGPSLGLELSTPPFGRVDLSLALRGGELASTSRSAEALELELAFARRSVLTSSLDLDLGLGARAGLLSLGGVSAVDGVAHEAQSWWARGFGVARLQPRLTRELRLDLGMLVGAVLRDVPLRTASGSEDRLGGVFFGLELGLVVTPAGAR